jgi:hypothetical protein
MTFRIKYRALILVSITGAIAAAVALSATTSVEQGYQSAKTGTVLDAATQQPLAGVYVVARWLEQTTRPTLLGEGGKVQGQCVFRAIARTDEHGRYSIPASSANSNLAKNWQPGSSRRYFWDLYTYANGYAATANAIGTAHPASIADTAPGQPIQTLQPILLTSAQTSPAQRLAALNETSSRFVCRPFAQGADAVQQQIAEEAAVVACAESSLTTCDERRRVALQRVATPVASTALP